MCREDNTLAAFTLLDRGSGNEIVTGSVRYGGSGWYIKQFCEPAVVARACIAKCLASMVPLQACAIRDAGCGRGPCAITSRRATWPRWTCLTSGPPRNGCTPALTVVTGLISAGL